MDVRAAIPSELDPLARIWFDGWQDAHARILPAELARHRTLESFRQRLHDALADVRVVGPPGEPIGFCITRDDELYQLYVSAKAHGSGTAAALLADAEHCLAARGVGVAWLACAIGNRRAARFYEKHGWQRTGNHVSQLPVAGGVFPLEVWRYEKRLGIASRPAVAVAHVMLETDCIEASARFMRTVGMRSIFEGPEVCVFELRGGTHLILMRKDEVVAGNAPFDLMVDDLRETHRQFAALGLSPSPIESRPAIDHDVFTLREPAGHVITFFSSHASGGAV